MDITERRRKNLAALVNKYTQAKAGEKFNKPSRQLGDMIAGRKSFGEKIAREMERNYAPHYPAGWLDSPVTIDPDDLEDKPSNSSAQPSNELTPRQQALLGLFEGLTASQQDALIRELKEKKQQNDELLIELLKRKAE